MPAEAQPEPLTAATSAPETDGTATLAQFVTGAQFTAPAATLAATAAVPVVTVDDVVTLGRLGEVTDDARAAIAAHLDGLLASLEARLNRPLSVREFVDDVSIGEDGRLWLTQSPVQAITAVQVLDWTGTVPVSAATDPRAYSWRPGVVVRVTYTAGLNADRYATLIRSVVAAKALPWARALLSRTAQAGGGTAPGGLPIPAPVAGVKAFSVEGLNVTYLSADESALQAVKTAREEAALAGWTAEELAALGTLRRPVVA